MGKKPFGIKIISWLWIIGGLLGGIYFLGMLSQRIIDTEAAGALKSTLGIVYSAAQIYAGKELLQMTRRGLKLGLVVSSIGPIVLLTGTVIELSPGQTASALTPSVIFLYLLLYRKKFREESGGTK